ncbi:MAG TPA: WhiB family transcriptional regulator [Acidimicrobiales bacterium]|jgi:WhiB family redox-sensing transcriptional regulator|nr:WhiB family transcriptional regulator [Acidimicrobiales bacterium]
MFGNQLLNELIDQAGLRVSWTDARCRDGAGTMTALFFSEQIDDIARAKAICTKCPLIDECLDGALERREPWGVWGGQLFLNGHILAQKRKRGRPPKNPRPDIELSA